jgi:hypothetical protein
VPNKEGTEHQLFEVNERSIFIDFSPSFISNAFLNSISNVFFAAAGVVAGALALYCSWGLRDPSAELKSL